MNRKVAAAGALFVALLALVLLTREPRVEEGVKRLQLPALEAEKIERIELDGAFRALLVREGERFVVADPAQPARTFRTDEALVKRALETLSVLRAGDLVTERPERFAELGLDDAQALRVTVTSRGASPVTVLLGKPTKARTSWLRAPDGAAVFAGFGSASDALRRDVDGWRHREFFPAPREELASLTVHRPGEPPYTLLADAGAFTLGATPPLPPHFRAEGALIEHAFTSLASLRASAFAASPPALDEATTTRLEAKRRDGSTIVVRLGAAAEGAPLPVRVDGDEQAYFVPATELWELARPLLELRALTLFAFDPAKVTRVTLESAGVRVTAERQGEAWAIVEPREQPPALELDPARVPPELEALSRLRAIRLVEPAPPEALTGLARPQARIDVVVDGETRTLRLGRELPVATTNRAGEVAALGASDPLVYALPVGLLNRYMKPLSVFRKAPTLPTGEALPPGLPPEVYRALQKQLQAGGIPTLDAK